MGRSIRKRPTFPRRMTMAAAALFIGGGGLVAVNVYASASDDPGKAQVRAAPVRNVSTIDCPDVSNSLPDVPDSARPEVDRELAAIDTQITDAYEKFASNKDRVDRDAGYAQQVVLDPLKDKRTASLDRIAGAVGRGGGQQPQGMQGLAPCTLRADDNGGGGQGAAQAAGQAQGQNQGQDQGQWQNQSGQGQNQGQNQGQGQAQQGQGQGQGVGNGPSKKDFVDIRSVRPNVRAPQFQRNGSTGLFTSSCGVNQNGKRNPDNVIVAPGVSNGAHHMHDYVGNQANDAFASDADLANGGTSCRNQGDKSTYYWPVIRLQNGQNENDANADGGGKDKNVGKIQTPVQVTIKFAGNPVSKVTAMPRFLRIITGDAKAFTNGNANANASWSCTGFENRQLKDKYPICPQGSKVVRTFNFQSCWDGKNTDSANHRTHVAFAGKNGACPRGFKAIPQLQQRIVYAVPPGPGFAVDSFPEQLHKPVTDHGDFINVFSDQLMRKAVTCINTGRSCA
ncbi:DUF1996 domain-containing protein [Streptomyces melanogenes]|uniref:DUF1996 domain-containing protein n=1 Tax=Streptomyces melanogenes TaxID=67326 RepID=A0ABZ1XJ72_9ACTN|nr:DUF1996 domain-containing protein [Streptomyces melanogenes]